MERPQQRALFKRAVESFVDPQVAELYQALVVPEQIPGAYRARQRDKGPAIGFSQIEPSTMRAVIENALINEQPEVLAIFGIDEMPREAVRKSLDKRQHFAKLAEIAHRDTLKTDEDIIDFETKLFPIIVQQKTDRSSPRAMNRVFGGEEVIEVIENIDFSDPSTIAKLQRVYNRAGKPRSEQQIMDQLLEHQEFMGHGFFGRQGPSNPEHPINTNPYKE